MTMPTMADTFRFIFRHDEWLKNQQAKWEIANFIETVDFIANRHYINEIPAIAEIKEQAGEIVRAGVKWRYYYGLDISQLIKEDAEANTVRIWEEPFGRAIPLTQLYDWVLNRRGTAIRIEVNSGGMSVTTSHGHTIMLPGCEIYLGRFMEDGRRYRIACALIEHITAGTIDLDYEDLINKTQNITVELINDKWIVDTGIPTTTS